MVHGEMYPRQHDLDGVHEGTRMDSEKRKEIPRHRAGISHRTVPERVRRTADHRTYSRRRPSLDAHISGTAGYTATSFIYRSICVEVHNARSLPIKKRRRATRTK